MDPKVIAAVGQLSEVSGMDFGVMPDTKANLIYEVTFYFLMLKGKEQNKPSLRAEDFILFVEGVAAGFVIAHSEIALGGTSEAGSE